MFFSLMGCVTPVNPNTVEGTTTPIVSTSVVKEAQRLVSDRMRDPEATRFKPEYQAYKTNVGDTIVCGTVNGKNAMGGYVGYKPFYVRIRNGSIQAFLSIPENDEYNFHQKDVLNACSEAASGKILVLN